MKKLTLNEDWTATLIGLAVILLIVFQLKPHFPTFKWNNADVLINHVVSLDNLGHILIVFGFSLLMLLLGDILMGRSAVPTLRSFPVIFILSLLGMTLGGNQLMNEWGIEVVIFCLLIGLFISNVFGTPDWLKQSLSSELYVKIGLVILGTSVLFGDLMQAGALGLLQAVIVVLSVWYFSFWVCKKLKVDKEMSMMLSSAVSICGVSAAVATAGAIKGDKIKLSYVVSLVLIVAIPMIIFMPFLAKWMGLSAPVAGAWIGGTIDTTGAVAATGSMCGEEALKYASIVKFSQNVLLGIAAFAISIYWSYSKKDVTQTEKPSMGVIWQRFPKFVLGFIFASLLFSFALSSEAAADSQKVLKKLQQLFFALAFTSIGLETNFRSLLSKQNGKATSAFLIAQTFNIIITLIVASILFGVSWDDIF